ncbi:hypothetical protein CsSME_00012432 [Camellia sinensis var. sinensis]
MCTVQPIFGLKIEGADIFSHWRSFLFSERRPRIGILLYRKRELSVSDNFPTLLVFVVGYPIEDVQDKFEEISAIPINSLLSLQNKSVNGSDSENLISLAIHLNLDPKFNRSHNGRRILQVYFKMVWT